MSSVCRVQYPQTVIDVKVRCGVSCPSLSGCISSVPDSAHYHNPVFISTSVKSGSEDCPASVYRPESVATHTALYYDYGSEHHCTVRTLRTCGHPVFASAAQYHLAVVYSNQRVINVCESKKEFFQQNLLFFRVVKLFRVSLTRPLFTLQRMI